MERAADVDGKTLRFEGSNKSRRLNPGKREMFIIGLSRPRHGSAIRD